jgi:hypothetical protein
MHVIAIDVIAIGENPKAWLGCGCCGTWIAVASSQRDDTFPQSCLPARWPEEHPGHCFDGLFRAISICISSTTLSHPSPHAPLPLAALNYISSHRSIAIPRFTLCFQYFFQRS